VGSIPSVRRTWHLSAHKPGNVKLILKLFFQIRVTPCSGNLAKKHCNLKDRPSLHLWSKDGNCFHLFKISHVDEVIRQQRVCIFQVNSVEFFCMCSLE